MSLKPPLPEAATPPFPAQPAPEPQTDSSPAAAAEKAAGPKISAKTIAGVGAAIGIGSAAIVAALLYANRGQKNKKS